MLKVKEKKLDELKKYGFKPKYDEDTGELYKYIFSYEECNDKKVGIVVYLTKNSPMKDRWSVYLPNIEGDFYTDTDKIQGKILDTLYELIQAGIVVKE